MIYEIVNPSDAYTMESDHFLEAAVAVLLLGNGAYGIHNHDRSESSPVLFGWDEWLKQEIGDEAAIASFFTEHTPGIAKALASVMPGHSADRETILSATKFMTPHDAQTYLAEVHDRMRSSLNNIGSRAWALAKALAGEDVDVPRDGSIILTGPKGAT